MKPGGKSKADLGFRRNQPFGTGARNSEPVTQRRKPVFPFVGRQRSVTCPSRRARNFCRVLQSGHCRCWSSFVICRSPKLGSSRSTEGVSFLGWRAPEQRFGHWPLAAFWKFTCQSMHTGQRSILAANSGLPPCAQLIATLVSGATQES